MFNTHRLLHHSTLSSRKIKKKKQYLTWKSDDWTGIATVMEPSTAVKLVARPDTSCTERRRLFEREESAFVANRNNMRILGKTGCESGHKLHGEGATFVRNRDKCVRCASKATRAPCNTKPHPVKLATIPDTSFTERELLFEREESAFVATRNNMGILGETGREPRHKLQGATCVC